MNNSLNLSEVIECIKNIVDCARCPICDKAEGGRARHPCGHTTCDGCLTAAEGCMLCLTPPSTLLTPAADEPASLRVENSKNLLKIFQDTFNVDVYKRLRISEQLKAEKELFPDCIQAPVKYYNKRKSLASKSNKENRSVLVYPGENISQSDSYKMNTCNNYVQEWLNNSEKRPRKALAEISVQNCDSKNIALNSTSIKDTESIQRQPFAMSKYSDIRGNKNYKRPYSSTSYSIIDRGIKSNLSLKKKKTNNFDIFKDELKKTSLYQNENDESGIVLDDEPILIEDSQSQGLDKDALALLAVQAADNQQEQVESNSSNSTDNFELTTHAYNITDAPIENHSQNTTRVQFYKKSALSSSCVDCKKTCNGNPDNRSKTVSITIESNSFVTTINISNLTETGPTNSSVEVQTEITENPITSEKYTIKETSKPKDKFENVLDMQILKLNQSVLDAESNINKKHEEIDVKTRKLLSPSIFELNEVLFDKKPSVVIDESDSDEGSLGDSVLHVTADVHRSCEPLDYGILGEISTNELSNRSKKKVRGVTPDSNNSSDKENCDPNKGKKRIHGKKNMKKNC